MDAARALLPLALTALSLSAQTSLQSRQMDLNYVANRLPQSAPNFFATLTPTAFQMAVNNLQSNLSRRRSGPSGSFSELLARQYGENLVEDARYLISSIISGADN